VVRKREMRRKRRFVIPSLVEKGRFSKTVIILSKKKAIEPEGVDVKKFAERGGVDARGWGSTKAQVEKREVTRVASGCAGKGGRKRWAARNTLKTGKFLAKGKENLRRTMIYSQ